MEISTIEVEAKSLIGQASFEIQNPDAYTHAGSLWNAIKEMRAKVAEVFDPIIEKAHKAHKEAVAQKKKFDEPLDQAQRPLKQGLIRYDEEEKRKAEKKRLELEAIERKKAEDEALEVAELLEQVGDKEAAEELLSKPVEPAPVAVQKATPKITGFSSATHWYAAITDLKAYLQAIVNGAVPLNGALGISEHKDAAGCYGCSYLTQRVGTDKEALQIPGVKVWSKKVQHARKNDQIGLKEKAGRLVGACER